MENSSRIKVVVLGGYGNFGARISRELARDPRLQVLVAGRNATRAAETAAQCDHGARPLVVDCAAPDFAASLRTAGAHILVHTAGPFQAQDYGVARASIEAGCHYLDIADGRDYVTGISSLDAAAKTRGVAVVSGASSVPALAAAVVDRYRDLFVELDSIDHAISAGAKPPGIATMRAVMGYVGKPFRRWEEGDWRTVHGWQNLQTIRFPPPVGRRWVGNCDVPDLALFPERYVGVRSVRFSAGVGFASTSLATWGLSWLVRGGLLGSLDPWSAPLRFLARLMEPFGSRWSGMSVRLSGRNTTGAALVRQWFLLAGNNDGPFIPCCPAIALTRKFARQPPVPGARPCLGLLALDEILDAIPTLDLQVVESVR